MAGTPLPYIRYDRFDPLHIRDAVSAVTRTVVGVPPSPAVRALLVRTAASHRLFEPEGVGVSAFAAAMDMSRSRVYRLAEGAPARGTPLRDAALAAAVRAVGDPRFAPLIAGDLLAKPGWAPYRWRR